MCTKFQGVEMMNAWVESGRTDSFANLHSEDAVVRTSSQTNSLVLGNGLNPYSKAAMYITSNCVGINRLPDTTNAATAHIVLDVGGLTACRSGMTWCEPATAAGMAVSGSNATRASVAGIVLNNGTLDTLTLDRTGHLVSTANITSLSSKFGSCTVTGQIAAQSGVFGSCTVTGALKCDGPIDAPSAVLGKCEVLGLALFDQGICMSTGPGKESTITYSSTSDVMNIGSQATLGQQGMIVDGTVVARGQMFSAGYKVLSDARLKRDVAPSDTASDLKQLLEVDVKRYGLTDNGASASASASHIGVLAHELAHIMPDAVSLVQDYLPDIMSLAHVVGQGDLGTWVLVPGRHAIRPGDNIRLRIAGGVISAAVMDVTDMHRVCIQGCAQGRRSLDHAPAGTELFLYGTLREDVMAVDTNHILFRLVSAVQSLSERLSRFEASSSTVVHPG